MPRVQIHCYGCAATVSVATAKSTDDLSRASWSLVKGETYCPKCAPEASSRAVSAGADEDVAALPDQGASVSAGGSTELGHADEAAPAAGAPEHSATTLPRRILGLARPAAAAGVAASILARVKSSRFGWAARAEGRLPPLRPAVAAVVSTLQVPFRKSHAPVTSHSKVSSSTIALFCIAAVLTLATLGSNDLLVRLPGVVCSFAAGLSWLRDLRNGS